MYTLSSEESSHDGLLLPVDTEVRNCGRSRPEEVTMSKNETHDTTTAGRATCVEALNVDMEVDCDCCLLFVLLVMREVERWQGTRRGKVSFNAHTSLFLKE